MTWVGLALIVIAIILFIRKQIKIAKFIIILGIGVIAAVLAYWFITGNTPYDFSAIMKYFGGGN